MSAQERLEYPVMLRIRGEQSYDDIEPDVTELMTEGVMSIEDGNIRFSYLETELTGMAGTTTSFTVNGNKVILSRVGSVCSTMVFEEGKQHTSLYETQFGEMSIDINTSRLKHNLTERGGLLEIRYTIAVEHAETSRSCFKISVRKKNVPNS